MNQLTHAQIAPSKRQAFNANPRNSSVPNEFSYHDAQKIRVSSLVAGSITRVGPVLRAGDVYSVRYWDTFTCKQRLAEVMGRMRGGALLERLLAL